MASVTSTTIKKIHICLEHMDQVCDTWDQVADIIDANPGDSTYEKWITVDCTEVTAIS